MPELVPWRCHILRWVRLHGRVWLRPDATPSGHRSCYGCGRMYRPEDPDA